MYTWAVAEGLLEAKQVPNPKPLKADREVIQPFSLREMKQILEAAKAVSPYYVDFITFLMLTGVRLSEAIGLRWVRVSFEEGSVTICESLSVDRTGNGYTRKLKATKSGSVRVLTMSEPLRDLLLPLRSHPDDLVFTSQRGHIIGSSAFRQQWIKILKAANVPYRRPHVIRHSFASHAIAQGVPLTGVSYMLGHADTSQVSRRYGHLIDRPELPRLALG
jgi:integrase